MQIVTALSRLIPTAYDSVIDSTEVSLLEHVYHLDGSRVAALIKPLATQYGPSIPYPSLREAILVLSASLRCGHYNEQPLVHRQKAYNILATKISAGASSINEADIFASFMLSYATTKRSEIRNHIIGCESMRRSLENSTMLLNVCVPIFKDAVINDSIYSHIPTSSRATFRERVECYWALSYTATPEWAWRFYRLDAMLYTLARTYSIGGDSILLNAILQDDEHRQRERIELAKVQMDIEMWDKEFQFALMEIQT